MRRLTDDTEPQDNLRLGDYLKMIAFQALFVAIMFIVWLNSPI